MRTFGRRMSRSPFAAVREHGASAVECANALGDAVAAFLDGRGDDLAAAAERVRTLESRADGILEEIRDEVSRARIDVAVRGGLLELLEEQDEICDQVEIVTDTMELRPTPVPDPVATRLRTLAAAAQGIVRDLDAATAAVAANDRDPSDPSSILRLMQRVAAADERCDAAERELNRALFAHEAELGPVSLVFLWRISRHLAEIASHAENTCQAVRRVILQ